MDLRERRAEREPGAARRHPWEARRASFFAARLEALRLPPGIRWLDAGAGDGWLATTIRDRSLPAAELTCWDANYEDHEVAALSASGATFVRERPPGTFDLVTALDVLEHVEDDDTFMRGLFESLRPGGKLLLSVPAWPSLYAPHDLSLGHWRRYRPAEGRDLVERAGFRVLRHGGLFHSLLPVRLGQRLLANRSAPPPEAAALQWRAGETTTKVVLGALALDNAVSRASSKLGLNLPGLTWWALAERPAG